MSREINNRQYRQQVIQGLLAQLHQGKSVDEVKAQFEEAFEGVSSAEIAEAEQALIAGGMQVSEVQKLCDVHAAVFKGSITEIHRPAEAPGGHPLDVLRLENRAIERLLEGLAQRLAAFTAQGGEPARQGLLESVKQLLSIDLHYSKKENLLFPVLEKHGITAPPKVMWGVDDEIRLLLKEAASALGAQENAREGVASLETAKARITEMIFKEENILFPMAAETFSEEEWDVIASGMGELGYCLIPAQPAWQPARTEATQAAEPAEPAVSGGTVRLPTGVLSMQELTRVLNALPIDITFVDADDTVKYFSEGAERVFPRTRAIIGRKVINCHPPASMHIVQGILDDFRAGKKDHEDFWIHMAGKYVLIRYYAVHGEDGAYMGTLEVTQDIAPLQAIGGEKRLVSQAPGQE